MADGPTSDTDSVPAAAQTGPEPSDGARGDGLGVGEALSSRLGDFGVLHSAAGNLVSEGASLEDAFAGGTGMNRYREAAGFAGFVSGGERLRALDPPIRGGLFDSERLIADVVEADAAKAADEKLAAGRSVSGVTAKQSEFLLGRSALDKTTEHHRRPKRVATPILAYVDRSSFPGFVEVDQFEERDLQMARDMHHQQLSYWQPPSVSQPASAATTGAQQVSRADADAVHPGMAEHVPMESWEQELLVWKRKYGCPEDQPTPGGGPPREEAPPPSVPPGFAAVPTPEPRERPMPCPPATDRLARRPSRRLTPPPEAEPFGAQGSLEGAGYEAQASAAVASTTAPMDAISGSFGAGADSAAEVEEPAQPLRWDPIPPLQPLLDRPRSSGGGDGGSIEMAGGRRDDYGGRNAGEPPLAQGTSPHGDWEHGVAADVQLPPPLPSTPRTPGGLAGPPPPQRGRPTPRSRVQTATADSLHASVPSSPTAGSLLRQTASSPKATSWSTFPGEQYVAGIVPSEIGLFGGSSPSAARSPAAAPSTAEPLGRRFVYTRDDLELATEDAKGRLMHDGTYKSEYSEAGCQVKDFFVDLRKQRMREKGRQVTGPIWVHLASQAKNLASAFRLPELLEALKLFCSVRYDDYELYMRLLGEVPHFVKTANSDQLCELIRLLARRRLRERNYVDMVAAHLLGKIRVTDDHLPARLLVKTANSFAALECRSQPKFVEHFLRHMEHRIEELDGELCCLMSPLFVSSYMTDALRRAYLKRCAEVQAGFHGSMDLLRNLACTELVVRREHHSFVVSLPTYVTRFLEKVRQHAQHDGWGAVTLPQSLAPDGPKGTERSEMSVALQRKANTSTGGRSGDVFSSEMHRDVSACLSHLGIEHENGVLCGPYLLDIVALDMVNPSKRITYEVNGPHHYYEGTETIIADKRLRHRMLNRLGQKLHIVHAHEWRSLTAAHRMTHLLKLQQEQQDENSRELRQQAAANTMRAPLPALSYDGGRNPAFTAVRKPDTFSLKSTRELSKPIRVPVPPSKRDRAFLPLSAR